MSAFKYFFQTVKRMRVLICRLNYWCFGFYTQESQMVFYKIHTLFWLLPLFSFPVNVLSSTCLGVNWLNSNQSPDLNWFSWITEDDWSGEIIDPITGSFSSEATNCDPRLEPKMASVRRNASSISFVRSVCYSKFCWRRLQHDSSPFIIVTIVVTNNAVQENACDETRHIVTNKAK